MVDLSREVPEFKYIDVGHRPPPFDFQMLCPVTFCGQCGERLVWDYSRDRQGYQRSKYELEQMGQEGLYLCEDCAKKNFYEAFEADILATLERRLGLTEENKKTLQALMSVIDNPDRVMMVARVQARVDELERRLEDRSNSLRDTIESKMENASSRLFVSSLITNAALFLAGLLFGIVVTLLLGP